MSQNNIYRSKTCYGHILGKTKPEVVSSTRKDHRGHCIRGPLFE